MRKLPSIYDPVDPTDPVNRRHYLNRGLVSWYLNLPQGMWGGGTYWRDLNRGVCNDGTLNNFFTTRTITWDAVTLAQAVVNGGATLSNDVPSAISGFSTRSMSFTAASSQYVSASGGGGTTNAFTISLWSKRVNDSSRGGYVANLNGQSGFTFEDRGALGLVTITFDTLTNFVQYGGLTTGVWQHLAVVFDGSQIGNANRLKFYLDGVEVTATTFVGTIPSTLSSGSSALEIAHGFTGYFNGLLDDVTIFTSALNATQIANIASGTNPATLSPQNLYKLDEMTAEYPSGWRGSQGRPGGFGSLAFTAPASNPRVDLNNFSYAMTGSFAITMQFMLLSKSGYKPLLEKRQSDANGNIDFLLRYDPNADFGTADRLYFLLSNGAYDRAIATSFGSPSVGVWYFVAAWYDSVAQTASIQVNGGEVDSGSATNVVLNRYTPTIGAGGTFSNSGAAMNGYIDDVHIYDIPLSQTLGLALCQQSYAGHPDTLNRLTRRRRGSTSTGLLARRRRAAA